MYPSIRRATTTCRPCRRGDGIRPTLSSRAEDRFAPNFLLPARLGPKYMARTFPTFCLGRNPAVDILPTRPSFPFLVGICRIRLVTTAANRHNREKQGSFKDAGNLLPVGRVVFYVPFATKRSVSNLRPCMVTTSVSSTAIDVLHLRSVLGGHSGKSTNRIGPGHCR